MQRVTGWFNKHFSNPQVIILAAVLLGGVLIVVGMGRMLAPLLAGLVIAYLLEVPVALLERLRVPRLLSVAVVFLLFLTLLVLILFGVVPAVTHQLSELVNRVPDYFATARDSLLALPDKYPEFVSQAQLSQFTSAIGDEIASFGQAVLKRTVVSLVDLIGLVIYIVLVPVLVFFFLKDKSVLVGWVRACLPKNRDLVSRVWKDVDKQIGNYVRGKVVEIVIVGMVTYLTFQWFGLNFSVLLATLVGFSVLIPFIGATVMTFPVALVAWSQFGLDATFLYVLGSYVLTQALDGNVLVPLLFSQVNNLHPVAIISAVLVFGGIWGIWGVFFAIPLATLVQAVMSAWPGEPVDAGVAGEPGNA